MRHPFTKNIPNSCHVRKVHGGVNDCFSANQETEQNIKNLEDLQDEHDFKSKTLQNHGIFFSDVWLQAVVLNRQNDYKIPQYIMRESSLEPRFKPRRCL